MVGIYKYEDGLKFTGMIATDKETAEKFLSEKYGRYSERCVGRDENGEIVWEKYFQPWYNKDVYKILELITVE